MTEHDYIRHMFETVNNSILTLSSQVTVLTKEVSEQKGETMQFRNEVLRHFATCPVEELREHTGQIDIELERLRARRNPDSSDKIGRPAISDRTVQLLIVLTVVAIGGTGVLVQIFGG
jgi:hypothetical protein